MTIYDDYEQSAHSGAPVEVYKFTGVFQNYYYTSAELPVTVGGQEYTPAAIKRAVINLGNQEDDNLDMEITLPYDLELVQDYAYRTAPPDLTLEIIRYHEGTDPLTDWITLWKGPVTSFSSSGHKVKILVPSIFAVVLRGAVPTVYYQNPCNHVLFDSRCKLSASSYNQETTITSVDGSTVEVADDGFADNYLRAGEIVIPAKGERRLIIDNVANILTLGFTFANAEAEDSVTLYAGCNHSFTECKTKFSNSLNFGGFPYVPTDNPFEDEL